MGKRSKGITFFPENFHWDEPFQLISPRNFLGFYTNGKRSKNNSKNDLESTLRS